MNAYAFNGKVVLVTGGASGIGEACVHTFVAAGAKVIIADLDEQRGNTFAAELKKGGSDVLFLKVNVADPQAVAHMVADCVATFGRLDIAINNAGIGGEANMTGTYTIEGWQKVIDINLNAVFYCMRYEIPQMVSQGQGVIVNLASVLGVVGFASAPAYVAAKHAVVGLTKTAALEYSRRGLRINCVGPGFIKTPMLEKGLDAQAQSYISGLHANGRMGEAQEVANLIAFLCSDQASFMTGGYYPVDGGYTAQ